MQQVRLPNRNCSCQEQYPGQARGTITVRVYCKATPPDQNSLAQLLQHTRVLCTPLCLCGLGRPVDIALSFTRAARHFPRFTHNNYLVHKPHSFILSARSSRLKGEANNKMADPFEVRMRFSSQLQHLNASVTSAQKAASYALKYKDMDEDLHSCILEQLERVCALDSRIPLF